MTKKVDSDCILYTNSVGCHGVASFEDDKPRSNSGEPLAFVRQSFRLC